jgi:hypothetical protein
LRLRNGLVLFTAFCLFGCSSLDIVIEAVPSHDIIIVDGSSATATKNKSLSFRIDETAISEHRVAVKRGNESAHGLISVFTNAAMMGGQGYVVSAESEDGSAWSVDDDDNRLVRVVFPLPGRLLVKYETYNTGENAQPVLINGVVVNLRQQVQNGKAHYGRGIVPIRSGDVEIETACISVVGTRVPAGLVLSITASMESDKKSAGRLRVTSGSSRIREMRVDDREQVIVISSRDSREFTGSDFRIAVTDSGGSGNAFDIHVQGGAAAEIRVSE